MKMYRVWALSVGLLSYLSAMNDDRWVMTPGGAIQMPQAVESPSGAHGCLVAENEALKAENRALRAELKEKKLLMAAMRNYITNKDSRDK